MEIEIKAKKWGNSIGLVIPSNVVEKLNIKPEEEIVIEIGKKKNVIKELFGTMKSKKTAKQMVAEARKELKSKWMQ